MLHPIIHYSSAQDLPQGKSAASYWQQQCLLLTAFHMQKSLSELNHIQVQRELDIHGRLHHANVLELYAVFEDVDAYYFVMQCAPKRVLCVSCPVLVSHTLLWTVDLTVMLRVVTCFTSSSAVGDASPKGVPLLCSCSRRTL